MTRTSSAPGGALRNFIERGPWGGGSGGSDGGGGGAGDGPGSSGDGKRNPWTPPLGPRPPRSNRGPSLEELFRRGGGGFGGLPDLGGRPWWAIALAALIAIWVLTSSIWLIGPQQQGVVTMFGKYNRTVGPGPAFTLPAPFETLQKVDTGAINTLSIGSESESTENRVLTGDGNIVDLAYQVRWSVRDPVLYLFQTDDSVTVLQDVAESSMRAAVANFTLVQALGPGRADIEGRVRDQMQRVLDRYRSGIVVQGITIRQSDPPGAVLEAFKRVNAAKSQRESYLNNARAYAQSTLERARGETAAFDKLYEQYRLAPEVTRRRMYYTTMENLLANVDKTVVEAPGVQSYLPLPEIRRSQRPPVATETRP